MAALLRIGMLLFAVLGMGFLFVNEMLNIGSKQNRITRHLDKLRASLSLISGELVSMDREELGLLSMDRLKKRLKNGSMKILGGQFLSIYNEPSLAYAWLKYSDRKSLLLINSKENEFYYLLSGTKVKIFANNVQIGLLTASGEVLDSKEEKKLLATIDPSKKDRFQELKNQDGKLLASLYNPFAEDRANQRVFHFIEDKMEEELMLVKALAFLNLAQRSNIS